MRIMRTLQLITIGYINQALQYGEAAALPDYSRIEDAVRHRTWQNLSLLPPHYLEAKAQPVKSAALVNTPSYPSATQTTPLPEVRAAPTARVAAVRADAPEAQQNSDWTAKFSASEKTVVELKAVENCPKICLSYHLRGTCFDACHEHATHRALTTAEKTAVQSFVEKHL